MIHQAMRRTNMAQVTDVGTLVNGVFVGKWSEYPSYSEPGDAGDAVFYFTNDCNSFSGPWQYGVHTTGAWSGGWVGSKAS